MSAFHVWAGLADFVNWWLLGVAFFFLIFGTFLSGAIRGIQSRKWPRTEGKVIESSIRENSGSDDSSTYEPRVRYSYEVEGKPHESKQISFVSISGSEAGAEAMVAKYPVGARVTVYYHPRLPDLAVLQPGRFAVALVLSVIAGAVFCFVVSIWWNRSLEQRPANHAAPPRNGIAMPVGP